MEGQNCTPQGEVEVKKINASASFSINAVMRDGLADHGVEQEAATLEMKSEDTPITRVDSPTDT